MAKFFQPSTILAIITGTLFFLSGFFLFTEINEPILATTAESETDLVEVVEETKEELPSLPIETPSFIEEVAPVEIPEEIGPAPTETPVSIPIEELAPETPSFIPKDLEIVNKQIQAALVNILCTATPLSPINSISGSGIIIDPSGTILTNAHIAQHLLLKDYPVEDSVVCTVRIGSPATDAYIADLAYISPLWVLENKEAISQTKPKGTGKDDFALLTITEATEFSSLPETFPFLPITFDDAVIGGTVISAGYPASFLGADAIRRNLVQISAAGTVQDIFTFNQTTVDVLSLGGVPLAQQGASGGAVVRSDGSLIGLVVTSSLEESTQERDLRAISTGHISRSFTGQHGTSFASYAFGDIQPEYEEFTETVLPTLRDLLLAVLGKL